MQEPKIHSRISPGLAKGHWLAGHDWSCENCATPVYDAHTGTLATWVETGLVALEHHPGNRKGRPGKQVWEPQVQCLHCFATRGVDVFPDMDDKWALTNKGGPQKERRDFLPGFVEQVEAEGETIPDNLWAK